MKFINPIEEKLNIRKRDSFFTRRNDWFTVKLLRQNTCLDNLDPETIQIVNELENVLYHQHLVNLHVAIKNEIQQIDKI